MPQASISCVVPTLNSAATLDQTLLSLRSQREILLRVIVVDSGSTDGTLEICRRWEVETLYAEPGNMYRAINVGLRESRTDWLAYLNSDDWVYPTSFARLATGGEVTKAGIVYGNCDYTDGDSRFVYSFAAAEPEHLLPLFRLGRMGFAQQAAIFRREVYERLQGFDETFRFRGDADFYSRALLGKTQFAKLDGASVACFRLHSNQFSNSNNEQRNQIDAEEALRIFGKHEMAAHASDWLKLASWRFRNSPHYLIRILRESLLSKKLRFPRTIETYTHR
jgi:glycosyltransferase involved in cell wall biosynthesis